MKVSPKSSVVRFMISLTQNLFPRFVRAVSYLTPRRLWYPIALQCSRLQGRLLLAFDPSTFDKTVVAHILEHWLSAFTSRGMHFSIPIRHSDPERLQRAAEGNHGLIICSAHMPLSRVIVSALLDLHQPPDLLIAGKPEREGLLTIWGMVDGYPAAPVTSSVLIKVRTLLRNGGSIVSIVDYAMKGPYSDNIFRLAKHTGSRVIFCLPSLQADGVVNMKWIDPPDPFCSSGENIRKNIGLLHSEVCMICLGTTDIDPNQDPVVKKRHTRPAMRQQLTGKSISSKPEQQKERLEHQLSSE